MEGRLRIGLGGQPEQFVAGLARVDRFYTRLRDEGSRGASSRVAD